MSLSTDEIRALGESAHRLHLMGRLQGMVEAIDEMTAHMPGEVPWLLWKRQQVVDEFHRVFPNSEEDGG